MFLMRKIFLLRALCGVAASMLFTAAAALAQPGSGGPLPTTTNSPTAIPLDGGASLLLAAGGAYGLKRLRAARAKR